MHFLKNAKNVKNVQKSDKKVHFFFLKKNSVFWVFFYKNFMYFQKKGLVYKEV